jgi:hypothetical protein
MGENIKKFLDSFNIGLEEGIAKQTAKKAEFKTARDNAIAIKGDRLGIWPNDPSVKTIGDLFAYVFPASGGVLNEPPMTNGVGSSGMTAEYEDYLLQNIKREPEFKKAYDELKRTYTGFVYSLPILKEKGGAQFWFDYFMSIVIDFYLKDKEILSKLNEGKTNGQITNDMLSGDGSKTADYLKIELFTDVFLENSSYNGYRGLENNFITNNLSSDESLLFNAFVEAGENYSGPYTNEIITSKLNIFKILDVRETPKSNSPVTSATASNTGGTASGTASNTGSTASATASTAGVTASGTASTSEKLKLTIKGITDGFQVNAKTDLPSFSVYVGDPEKWPVRENASEEFQNVDGAEVLDEEYVEEKFDESTLDLDVPSDNLEKALGSNYTESDKIKEEEAKNNIIVKIEGRIPVRQSDADTFWKQLEKYYGEKEVPAASNKGKNITRFLKEAGVGSPAPWCMAFVYSNFKEFTEGIGQKNMLKKTAHCLTQWSSTPSDCQILATLAAKNPFLVKAGQVFIKTRDGGGHTGIVLKRDGDHFYSIDGNSGDMVRLNKYKISNMLGFIEYFSNDAFQNRLEELASAFIVSKSFSSGGKET